jgi:hypothetical protein
MKILQWLATWFGVFVMWVLRINPDDFKAKRSPFRP